MSQQPKQQNRTESGSPGVAVTQYERQVHKYLLRRLRRPQDVDDLAQEVYLRVLRLEGRLWMNEPLAYLYTVAGHVLSDFWKGIGHEQQLLLVNSEAVEHSSEAPGAPRQGDSEDQLNLRQQIDRALAQLPIMHRQVLLLHKRDGLSYEEVARRLELSVHTVEKYVMQAKARFRTMKWDR